MDSNRIDENESVNLRTGPVDSPGRLQNGSKDGCRLCVLLQRLGRPRCGSNGTGSTANGLASNSRTIVTSELIIAARIAQEAPAAYKDVGAVIDAADAARLSRKVANPKPLVCIKI
jgi:hypothetical protein